jgi:hypothetical protein
MVWCTSSSRHLKKQDLHNCKYERVCRKSIAAAAVQSAARAAMSVVLLLSLS